MRRRVILVSLMCLVFGAPCAFAQAPAPAGIGVRAFVNVDAEHYTASKTFSAIFSKTTFVGFGGGVEIDRLWRGLFVRGGISRTRETGTRVFIFNGETFRLGVPLTMTITPIEVSVGWQIGGRGAIQPYMGLGILSQAYAESSSFQDSSEAIAQRNTGFIVFGGANLAMSRHVSALLELEYRSVPNALGQSGISKDFKETNLGGVVIRFLLAIGK